MILTSDGTSEDPNPVLGHRPDAVAEVVRLTHSRWTPQDRFPRGQPEAARLALPDDDLLCPLQLLCPTDQEGIIKEKTV